MSEAMQMWTEIAFNLLYLVTVWGLIVAMARKKPYLLAEEL